MSFSNYIHFGPIKVSGTIVYFVYLGMLYAMNSQQRIKHLVKIKDFPFASSFFFRGYLNSQGICLMDFCTLNTRILFNRVHFMWHNSPKHDKLLTNELLKR